MSESLPGLVTVFGGSGFVGIQAVRALARKGWRIRVAVRKPALAQDLRVLGDVGQIQPVRCDITRPDDVAAALRGADEAGAAEDGDQARSEIGHRRSFRRRRSGPKALVARG